MANIDIHIMELGPVRDCEMMLAPVMLFTGKSNMGKSYVNFLAYYVYNLFSSHRLDSFITNKIPVDMDNADKFTASIKTDDLRMWMEDDVKSFFQYLLSYKDIPCTIRFLFKDLPQKIELEYAEAEMPDSKNDADFYGATLSVNGQKRNILMSRTYTKEFLLYDICRFLGEMVLGKRMQRSFLFPPGRASLLSGNYSTQYGSSRLGMYDVFLRDNDEINRDFMRKMPRLDKTDNSFFLEQVHNLINGRLNAEKDGISFVLDNGQSIPLDAAASSVKELTPLLMWMQGQDIQSQSVCIEEPEAHLHPEMQIAVANLLAACVNKGTFMQITTHSDYFMQRVNQLLKLGCLRDKDEDAFKAFCREHSNNVRYYLDRKHVKAYYFHAEDGSTKMQLLEIGDEGIPMSTFFDAVDVLSQADVAIDDELKKTDGSGNC